MERDRPPSEGQIDESGEGGNRATSRKTACKDEKMVLN